MKGKGCGQQHRYQYAKHLEWPIKPPQAPPHKTPRAADLHGYATHTLALQTRNVATPTPSPRFQHPDALLFAKRVPCADAVKVPQVLGRRYDPAGEIPRRGLPTLPQFRTCVRKTLIAASKLWRDPHAHVVCACMTRADARASHCLLGWMSAGSSELAKSRAAAAGCADEFTCYMQCFPGLPAFVGSE